VTLLALLLLAVLALAPLAWALRRPGATRSRRESALALHRAQLAELDRDLAENRLVPAEHAAATLEVQRRLLAAAEAPDAPPPRAARAPLLAALVLVPLLAGGLYAIDGRPFLPDAPLAERQTEAREAEAMIALLRERLATLDQHSETARQGYVLLGNAENGLGHLAQAAAAWHQAVAIRFDPALATLAAEAQTRVDGKVSAESAALFRRALAEGPRDAPWRKIAQQRLGEAGG